MFSIAVLSVVLFFTPSHACNYIQAAIQSKLFPISLGTFSFALDRCQGMSVIPPKVPGLNMGKLAGSLLFKAHGADIYLHRYTDSYCTTASQKPTQKITSVGTKIPIDIFGDNTLVGGLELVIKTLPSVAQSTASQSACGISIAAGRDCRWGGSDFYVNISLPTGQCVTPVGDFGSAFASRMLSNEVPPSVAKRLKRKVSMKVDCCADGSLLIANYTGSHCAGSAQRHVRIPASYNGACLNMTGPPPPKRRLQRNRQKWGRHGRWGRPRRPPPSDSSEMIVEMRWECSTVVAKSCASIPVMKKLPPKCNTKCAGKSISVWEEIVKKLREQAKAKQGAQKTGPQATAVLIPTDQGQNQKKGLSPVGVVGIVLLCVIVLIIIGALSYWCLKKRAPSAAASGRRAYEPMMVDELHGQQSNVVQA